MSDALSKLSGIIFETGQLKAPDPRPLSVWEKFQEIQKTLDEDGALREEHEKDIFSTTSEGRETDPRKRVPKVRIPGTPAPTEREDPTTALAPGAPVPRVRDGAAGVAFMRGSIAGFLKGVLYPVSSFVPSIYDALDRSQTKDQENLKKYLEQPTWGVSFSSNEAAVLSKTPGFIGELAGFAVPGVPIVKGTNAALRIARGTALTGVKGLAKTAAAGGISGGLFSVLAKHDSGEDRAYATIQNIAIGAAGEAAVFGAIWAVTKRELTKQAPTLMRTLVAQTTEDAANVESRVTTLRAGINPQDTDIAEAVIKASDAVDEPHTPVVDMAKKVVEAQHQRYPISWTIDRTLPQGHGAFLMFEVDGVPQNIRLGGVSGAQPGAFESQVMAFKQVVDLARDQQGKSVRFLGATAPNQGIITRINNILSGKMVKKGAVPASPAVGTVSHNGNVPPVGSKVFIRAEGGKTEAVVKEVGRPTGPHPADDVDDLRFDTTEAEPPHPADMPLPPDEVSARQRRYADQAGIRLMEETVTEKGRTFTRFTLDPDQGGTTPGQRLTRFKRAKRLYERMGSDVEAAAPEMQMTHPGPSAAPPRKSKILAEAEPVERPPTVGSAQPLPAEPSAFETQAAGYSAENLAKKPKPSTEKKPYVPAKGDAQKVPPGHVLVTVGNRDRVVPMGDVFTVIPQKGPSLELKPHKTASVRKRRFLVDLDNGQVDLEPFDQPGDWWRSPLWDTEDPMSEFNQNRVKGIVHTDNSLTLSATPVSRFETESRYSPTTSYGPQDRAASQRVSESAAYKTGSEGKAAAGIPFAPDVKAEGYYSGRFKAGFQPRSQRTEVRTGMTGDLAQEALGTSQRGRVFTDVQPLGEMAPSTRKKVTRLTGEPLDTTLRPPVLAKDPLTGKFTRMDPEMRASTLKGFVLDKTMGSHPEAVTLRNAARALLKKGAAENTPVRPRIAHDTHRAATEAPTMTLGELANMDLRNHTLSDIADEAMYKGYRAYEDKGKVILESTTGAEKREFDHVLEAMEALGRVPHPKAGMKIEEPLERAWNIGRRRQEDPDVDLKKYANANLVEQAANEVASGLRPGMEMYVERVRVLGKDVKTAIEGAFDENIALVQQTLDAMTAQRPIPGGLKVVKAGDVGNRQRAFVYNPPAVRAVMKKYEGAFDALGIPVTRTVRNLETGESLKVFRNEAEVINAMSKLPDGLDVFKGRDPSDAFMYTWYKKHGLKEEFQRGKLAADTQGPYRVFPKEEKAVAYGKLPPC